MRIAIPRSLTTVAYFAFVLACLFQVGCGGEPRHKGKKLSAWIKVYQDAGEASSDEERARMAVRAIGTNALPYLTRWIVSSNMDEVMQAKLAFEMLGPIAAPAVPSLICLLDHKDGSEFFAATALASIGPVGAPALLAGVTNRNYQFSLNAILALPGLGTNARPAIPLLLAELNNPDHNYRQRSTVALGNLHIEPDTVVPALANLLQDPSPAVRFHAINALQEFGPRARIAAPSILNLMRNDEAVRSTAKNALKSIAPDMLVNTPPK